MKEEKGKYDHLHISDIVGASNGNIVSLGKVAKRYESYTQKCLKNIARNEFGFDIRDLPLEDVMQEVWMLTFEVIKRNFHPEVKRKT